MVYAPGFVKKKLKKKADIVTLVRSHKALPSAYTAQGSAEDSSYNILEMMEQGDSLPNIVNRSFEHAG